MDERLHRRGMTRRRAITVIAAFAGLPLPAVAARPDLFANTGAAITFTDGIVTWHGQALGAPAQLILHHEDEDTARRLVGRIVAEAARLEAIFSLYRDASALSELNRTGVLAAPPGELVALLRQCRDFHAVSGGAFDPTVQPLWRLYSRHFAMMRSDPGGPSAAALAAARTLVGFEMVRFNRDRVAFARPGVAMTLNGIAQGFVTDRAVDMMKQAGMTSSLVDMGEIRAVGSRADGAPWRVGLARTGDTAPDKIIELTEAAVATSSAAGFHFDTSGRFSHLLDPRSGAAAARYARMSVIAPDATTADALSTAFSLMEPDAVRAITATRPGIAADFVLSS
ncbi:thiamine biosynthesis lipoprotein [Pseudochelatococcus lubricantis]|uniref:FAD:protein FMN transferase n=1 Tax=Pseudochelatococcus lubricantis TaxID=1538102 RepID=A0ABX0V3P7_9HYPH|nr:FAD:protein FMN transferase [Pseudochelatococcus lubricantis]NIJ59752.1 thiamine biosynthesis lipoprotein [Pseudochelatococcus lubricantis]